MIRIKQPQKGDTAKKKCRALFVLIKVNTFTKSCLIEFEKKLCDLYLLQGLFTFCTIYKIKNTHFKYKAVANGTITVICGARLGG